MKKFIIMAIVSLLFAFFSAYAILISSRNEFVSENVQRKYVELETSEVKVIEIQGCAYIFWGRDMEHFQGCPVHAHLRPSGDEPELKLNY